MKNKSVIFLCAIALVFGMVTAASAVPVQFTYTGDNVVAAWYQDGSGPVSLGLGPYAGNWQVADTAILDLGVGTEYQIIWQVENLGDPGLGNPGGFLAEISSSTPLIVDSLLSSSEWEVAFLADTLAEPDWSTLTWSSATEYGANNDSTTIWYAVHGGPVADIAGAAQWIWTDLNFDDPGAPATGDSVFIRVSVAPVPEPSTMLLLASGLIGLVALRKKFRKR